VVFTLNLILGFTLTAAVFLIAPWVADYFHEPDAVPLLRALGFTFAVEALGTVHLVRLQRELRFGRALIPDVGQSILKGAVSIGLALAGMGAWSLVLGQLAGVATGVLLSWAVFRWIPRLEIDASLAGKLIAYGLPLFGVEVMWVVSINLDYVIIGRRLGSELLGIYTLAYRLPELLVLSLMAGVNRVVFPAMSTVQASRDNLRRGFLATTHYVVMVTLPISLGLAIAADPIVRVTLGSDWAGAIPVLRILAIFTLVASMMNADGDVYKAVGRPGILFWLAALGVAMLVPALLFGVEFGLIGVAIGHLCVSITMRVIRTIIVSRFLEIPVARIAAEWRTPFLGGLALASMAALAMHLTDGASPIVTLAATVVAGAIGYFAVVAVLEGASIVALLRSALRSSDAPVGTGADEIVA
jgi:PST family polysaccharide transporter